MNCMKLHEKHAFLKAISVLHSTIDGALVTVVKSLALHPTTVLDGLEFAHGTAMVSILSQNE